MHMDYDRQKQQFQPLTRRQAMPPDKAKLPSRLAGCKLAASWKTRVGGKPAEAFALQRGNHLITHYRITANVCYRYTDVRQTMVDYVEHSIANSSWRYWPAAQDEPACLS